MKSLVEIIKNEPLSDSRVIAQAFEQKHTYLMELLFKHQSKLEQFGVVRFETVKPKTGRPMKIALLTEPQSLLLLTYTRSRDATDKYRYQLIKEFTEAKKLILHMATMKQNQEWLTNREDGKLQRKATTDVIQKFVDYSVSQGSRSAKMYYMNISKLENKSLFFVQEKFPNLREVMNNRQLSFIQSADIIVEEAIIEGMEKEMFYKDIFQLCKKRVESFSELIPKTSIPMMIKDK